MTPRIAPSAIQGARLAAGYLFGGLVLGVGLGSMLTPFPHPPLASEILAAMVALGVVTAAGVGWGRAMGRAAGAADLRRMGWAGALGFGPPVIFVGVTLSVLESILVGDPGRTTPALPTHVVYTLLFVPAMLVVPAMCGLALGVGLGERALAPRLARDAGLAAAIVFLAVDLGMDVLGWRVGGPDAARRATMVTVTSLGAFAATLAAGAALGRRLSIGTDSAQIRTTEGR